MKVAGVFVALLAAWPIATAVPFRMAEKLAPIRRAGSGVSPHWETLPQTKSNGASNTTIVGTRSFIQNGLSTRTNLTLKA